MKKVLLALILTGLVFSSLWAAPKKVIAVMDFKQEDRESSFLVKKLPGDLEDAIKASEDFELADRKSLKKAVEDLGLTMEDVLLPDECNEVGVELGIDAFVFGSIRKDPMKDNMFVASFTITNVVSQDVEAVRLTLSKKTEDREQAAVEVLQKTQELLSGAVAEILHIAQTHMHTKDYDSALGDFDRLLEIDPNYAMAHYYKGAIYVAKNQMEQAIESLETAREMMSDSVKVYASLGHAYLEVHDYQKGKDVYLRYTELAPEDELAWLGLGKCYENYEETEDAIEAYLKVIEINDSLLIAYKKLSDIYYDMEEYEDALPYLELITEKVPEDNEAAARLAKAYKRTGNYDQAIQRNLELLEENPEKVSLWSNLAAAYKASGQEEKAIEAYQSYLKLRPDTPTALLQIADSYLNLKNYAKSKEYASRVLKQDANSGAAYLTLGDVATKQGYPVYQEYSDVAATLNQTRKYDEAEALFHRVDGYFQDAKTYYEKALKSELVSAQREYVKTQLETVKKVISQLDEDRFYYK